MVPAAVVSCWSCDASNPPSRMFCAECGSFIAIGSKVFSGGSAATTSVAAAMSGPATAIAGAGMSGAGMGGTTPLGSYKVAMAEYQRSSRRRWLLAAVSVLLVAIVGLSAIYAALDRNGDGGTPGPAAAVLVAPTAAPVEEPTEELVAQPIEEVAAEPEPMEPDAAEPAFDEGEPVNDAEPVEPMEPELSEVDELAEGDEPALTVEEAAMVAAESATEPESAVEPKLDAAEPPDPADAAVRARAVEGSRIVGLTVEEPALLDGSEVDEPSRPNEPAPPIRENPPVWRNGWVCDGELSLKDERLRDWAITRVSFLPGDGFERVALQLERVGAGSGGAAVMSAEVFPTARVKEAVPNVRQPSSGRTTLALQFRGGVRSQIGLRGYQPSGLSSVKEFNAYPVGQTASRVLVSSSGSGCFRVRVPAFTASPNAQRGQVLIDIKS